MTEVAGVGDLGLSRVAHFADLNSNGLLDLVVVNDTDPGGELGPSRLYRNNGDGSFTDVTAGSGFHPVGYIVGGAALTDYDADGDLDIYLSYWTMELAKDLGTEDAEKSAQGVPKGVFPGTNRLFENQGGFRFSDVTDDVGLGGIRLDSFTAIFHDFDSDSDPDLYVAVDHREDIFYENTDGIFVDRSESAGVDHLGNDMGVAVADIDGNGYVDLYLTNVSDPALIFGSLPRGNTLLMVGPGENGVIQFVDHAPELEVTDTGWGWGTAFTDVDLDGDLDLFVVQGFDAWLSRYRRTPGQGARAADQALTTALLRARSRLFINDGSPPFRIAEGSGCDVGGDQRSLIPFDYDRDGDADFLITQVGAPTLLLENKTQGNHWLTVILDERDGRGVGAEVAVTTGDTTVRQVVLGAGSYLAGTPSEAYFGLGFRDESGSRRDHVERRRPGRLHRRGRRPGPRLELDRGSRAGPLT